MQMPVVGGAKDSGESCGEWLYFRFFFQLAAYPSSNRSPTVFYFVNHMGNWGAGGTVLIFNANLNLRLNLNAKLSSEVLIMFTPDIMLVHAHCHSSQSMVGQGH